MGDFDAVVAGGGPNGLAAALRLAEAGWSVCLLEANQGVGGSARTVECTLPGFRHDLGAGFLALAMISPAIAGRDLARFGLRFRHAPVPAAHPLPGGRAITLDRTATETAASIGRINRDDAAAWTQLDQRFGDAVVALVCAGMVRWPIGQGAQLLGRLGPRDLLELGRLVIQGGSAIADRFVSEEARAFLVAPGMHSDLQPEVGGSGAYALIMHLLGERSACRWPRAAAAPSAPPSPPPYGTPAARSQPATWLIGSRSSTAGRFASRPAATPSGPGGR
jgi:phytoene dehydrogenase-like protein